MLRNSGFIYMPAIRDNRLEPSSNGVFSYPDPSRPLFFVEDGMGCWNRCWHSAAGRLPHPSLDEDRVRKPPGQAFESELVMVS